MPIIHFYAWINRNDPTDGGHLVMFDCQSHLTLEITQTVLKKGEKNVRYVEVGPPSLTLTHKGSGQKYTGRSSPIGLKEEGLTASFSKQLGKMKGPANRFTHVYKIAVKVTEDELTEIRHRAALALAGGQFNIYGEARIKDPTAGRCLLPLEVLASARGQRSLAGSNAFEYLQSFMKWNKNSCFGENGAVTSDKKSVDRLLNYLRIG